MICMCSTKWKKVQKTCCNITVYTKKSLWHKYNSNAPCKDKKIKHNLTYLKSCCIWSTSSHHIYARPTWILSFLLCPFQIWFLAKSKPYITWLPVELSSIITTCLARITFPNRVVNQNTWPLINGYRKCSKWETYDCRYLTDDNHLKI